LLFLLPFFSALLFSLLSTSYPFFWPKKFGLDHWKILKRDLDQLQVYWPVQAPSLQQKWIMFFFDLLCQNPADIQNEQSCRRVNPSSICCFSQNTTDVLIDDVTSGSMTAPANSAQMRV